MKGISFTVPKGTLTTILGPSGCGKTTTLRMIAGLEAPTGGQIFIDGVDVTTLGPAERNVSMVFQSYALFPHMNVLANVAYGLSVSGVNKAETKQRAHAAMATVGLTGFDERLPSELSGGQQQRVALARALVLEPAVLLFDEPLSNLDARLRRSMREEIRALQQRLGLTVAYVTHDQSEALAVSDQIIVMDHGVIAQAGTPHDLYERPGSEFVAGFMGEAMLFDGASRVRRFGARSARSRCPARGPRRWRPARSRSRCGPRPGRCCRPARANWPARSRRAPTSAASTSTPSRPNWGRSSSSRPTWSGSGSRVMRSACGWRGTACRWWLPRAAFSAAARGYFRQTT